MEEGGGNGLEGRGKGRRMGREAERKVYGVANINRLKGSLFCRVFFSLIYLFSFVDKMGRVKGERGEGRGEGGKGSRLGRSKRYLKLYCCPYLTGSGIGGLREEGGR